MIVKDIGQKGGSITVFMTFIFLLLFALTGAVLDSARFFGSGGYMKASAYGADVAVYGNYNRELFRDYGLFGYGGYDGIGESDWTEDYKQALYKNLAERPAKEEQGRKTLFSRRYSSVYQLGAISISLEETAYLTQEDQFMVQLGAWLKTTAWKDITQKLLDCIQGTDQGDQQSLLEGLDKTAQIEQKTKEEQKKSGSGDVGGSSVTEGMEDENRTGVQQEDEGKGNQGTGTVSAGKENPLEFLRSLMRDGVLALVCNEDSLAENEVYPREAVDEAADLSAEGTGDASADSQKESKENGRTWDQRKSGTGILRGLLRQTDSLWDNEMLRNQKKKGKLLLYVSEMLGSYVDKKDRTVSYGLEYVVTGKQNQRDAIAAVVNRLFLIRTLLNYVYVSGNPFLQEKSMITATAIAAALAAEAFIPVLQQSILLILSLEEACVDITALLAGKMVPVLKNQTNFKMKYEELCMAGKVLFQQKAAAYPEAGEAALLEMPLKGIGYVHYLWLLLLMTSWDNLYQRSLDVIQSDLREKYNQSFELDCCICQTKVSVCYGIPLLSSVFLVKNPKDAISDDRILQGRVMRRMTISYGYQ